MADRSRKTNRDAWEKSNPQAFAALRQSWDYRVPKPFDAADRVYEFEPVIHDPRFAKLELGETFLSIQSAFAEASQSPEAMKELRRLWHPARVIGRCAVWNDNPIIHGAPALSGRAVDALEDLLTPNGELFPFKSRGRQYWFFIARTVENILNVRQSNVRRRHTINGLRTLEIDYYQFKVEAVRRTPIFRIKQQPFNTFVTDAFVRRVNERELLGFHFGILFPLRPADIRGNLPFQAEQRHLAEGYPHGQRLDGSRVLIKFKLDNPDRVPTSRQERQIRAWAKRVANDLFDIDSIQPPLGYLASVEANTGDMTCVFCGPRASIVLARVRPLIPDAGWHGRVVVVFGRR
jgi:hypothetical protein